MKRSKRSKVDPKVPAVLLAGLVSVGGYALVWQPQSDRMARAAEDRARAERDLQLGFAHAELEAGTASDPARVSRWAAAVPASPALAEVLRTLDRVAAQAGMATTTISPATAAVTGPLQAVTLSVTASGSEAAAHEYVRLLGTLERVVVVDQLSLQVGQPGQATAAAPEAGAVQLQLTARVFSSSPFR